MELRVISSTAETGIREYFAYDRDSGYPYWGPIHSAHMFGDSEEDKARLEEEFDEIVNGKESIMSDGTKYPNRMIHDATGVCNTKREGKAVIEILVLTFTAEKSVPVVGRIVKPTGFSYD